MRPLFVPTILSSLSFLAVHNSIGTASSMATATTKPPSTTSQSHYESHSVDSYEKAYFYEPGTYMKHMLQLTYDSLQLSQINANHRILDIGGGTGNFALGLVEKYTTDNNTNAKKNRMDVVVVDPFLDPTTCSAAADTDETLVKFVKASAEAFLQQDLNNNTNHKGPEKEDWWWRRQDFHQVLLKEVTHHFDSKDRVGIFRGMYQELKQQPNNKNIPSLLIITRPQIDIDYPLWDEAYDVWKNNQPNVNEFISELEQAGFVNVQYKTEEYPCSIEFQRWQTMIQNKFWSTFSHFTDEQLKEACKKIEIDHKHRINDQGIIEFTDRLLFITAYKEL